MSAYTPPVTGTGGRARVQRAGAFLAGMVMPNLGAFIAFGLITALFIDTGWVNYATGHVVDGKPVDTLTWTTQIATVVGPLINILVPILIGYTGGKNVYETRGAVVGAVATIGVMLAPVALQLTPISLNGEETTAPASIAEIGPAILGAFVVGPLAAWLLKKWDSVIAGKIRGGFEMLVDNFSAGIIGGILAIFGIYVVGPLTYWLTQGIGWLVNELVKIHLLPVVSILVEPAKVLFLNNAINHGVFTPIGSEQAGQAGQSILFMIESNPGPGLGILTAMLLFGPRAVRPTVPAAMVVHFLGGIHEIYFPYVLMKPILVIAAIAGGATGVLWESIFGLGLRAPASPGSIIAWLFVSPPNEILLIVIGVILSAAVSAVVGFLLLGFGRREKEEGSASDLEAARAQSAANKAASKNQPTASA
ncbi:PTS mannitol transporter subunit IICB [Galbitalea sp. SE-J8]|uniref:PTS mannitol transporter subunit IICB n=1 Tax=Galbitalea sp. SE-J8 TaxID=3054952 RepID=UPI00259CDA96|nr:PTS mannitol transporter subunit IICB [Galbitalea sp. SE-J8]MDM4763093.1 PTS mannitol transporter subunit IICB [Galbitalea sp. SE-J8]